MNITMKRSDIRRLNKLARELDDVLDHLDRKYNLYGGDWSLLDDRIEEIIETTHKWLTEEFKEEE